MYRDPAFSASVGFGRRRMTRPMLATMSIADAFQGEADLSPGKVLAAFKAVAPFLGLRIGIIGAVDWLFKFTQAIDWRPGARPIVWPSAAEQQLALGQSAAQVKYLNRRLAELGLIIMRDSPNGRRFGERAFGKTGPIIEAYGFDLSPLGARLEEFRAIVVEARARQKRVRRLRRRATAARNTLLQLFAAASLEHAAGFEITVWQHHLRACGSTPKGWNEKTLTEHVAVLEQMVDDVKKALNVCLDISPIAKTAAVKFDPERPENQPPITATNKDLNPTDTVGDGVSAGKDSPCTERTSTRPWPCDSGNDRCPHLQGTNTTMEQPGFRMTPEELVRLAPKFQTYLARSTVTWSDVVDAADWVRAEVGISKPLWGKACLALGRTSAAVAIAIVSTRAPGHFRVSPGAYLAGMVQRSRSGALYLEKSIWGLRAESLARTRLA